MTLQNRRKGEALKIEIARERNFGEGVKEPHKLK